MYVPPEDGHVKARNNVEDSNVTYMLLLNCALKLVEEIIPHEMSLIGCDLEVGLLVSGKYYVCSVTYQK